MLSKPVLARCDNRNRHARKHPSSGDPEDWLSDTYLKTYGLFGLTFDFLVNWTTGSIPNELWIKRIVHDAFTPWPITRWRGIPSEIHQCDGEEKVQLLCRFADTHDFTCHYFLFKESADSRHPPTPIVEVKFDGNGTVERVLNVNLSNLMDRIRQLRGGPFTTNKKLTYGQTSLDCYLYNYTDVMFPGDADLVLVDSSFTPRVIIEFKKHTSYSSIPFDKQKFSNYYPKGDPYKYDSFAYFRDHFTNAPSALPIVVLYYSIETNHDYVMLEPIEGSAPRGLRETTDPVRIPLPNANDEASCKKLIEALLGMI